MQAPLWCSMEPATPFACSVCLRAYLSYCFIYRRCDVIFCDVRQVACDASAACASLMACCATVVALSRIDCGSEGFELTSMSDERAVCRRTRTKLKTYMLKMTLINLSRNYSSVSAGSSSCSPAMLPHSRKVPSVAYTS